MEDDIPDELSPFERHRREEADRVWGWRKFEEHVHNNERWRAWWRRWVDHHNFLWALGRPNLTRAHMPNWKWKS